jgi:precorrin-2/cobalt-factor-2 C20-methyltransferase
MQRVLDVVRGAGRLDDAVYGARLGIEGERVEAANQIGDGPAPYLSTLIVSAKRTNRGGKL